MREERQDGGDKGAGEKVEDARLIGGWEETKRGLSDVKKEKE